MRSRLTDIENRLVVTSGEREGGRGNIEKGTNYYVKNKLQGYIVQHEEDSQYFKITKWSITFKNCHTIPYICNLHSTVHQLYFNKKIIKKYYHKCSQYRNY